MGKLATSTKSILSLPPCTRFILTFVYRFAVATVMFVTTTLITIQIPHVKHKPWILAIAWLLFFGFFDGLFWGAALRKVPTGAWVPLVIGAVA